jgi:hypothetical protein
MKEHNKIPIVVRVIGAQYSKGSLANPMYSKTFVKTSMLGLKLIAIIL